LHSIQHSCTAAFAMAIELELTPLNVIAASFGSA